MQSKIVPPTRVFVNGIDGRMAALTATQISDLSIIFVVVMRSSADESCMILLCVEGEGE